MKILLISSNVSATPYSVYPLGLAMVAKALTDANHQVEIFDFLKNDRSLQALAKQVKKINPDLIGISIRNIDNVNLLNEQRYISAVKEIILCLRKLSSLPIVIGGSAFSIMPEQIINEVGADYGVVGEGESIFVNFVNNAAKGIYPKNKIIKAPAELSGKQISSAYYDPSLMSFYLKSGNVASLQTKRGCNNNCIYCTYPYLEGKKIRSRDPKEVVSDMELLSKKYKAKYIFFTDSVFNDDQGHYLKIIREMKTRNINVPWCAFFKPTGLDSSIVKLMKQTGLKAAEIGADAASDVALNHLGKDFSFSDVISTNNLLSSSGVATAHYFMFGGPGETKESIYEGIENIKNLKSTVSFMFMGIRILPGTKLYDLAVKQNFIKYNQNLLESVYYIAPGIDKAWLEETLTTAFEGIKHCIFPPDALDKSLQFLHKMGYSGSIWDMLIPKKSKKRIRKNNVNN